jgi:hypothetical protein
MDVDAEAVGFQDRAAEGRDRALAIGAGHMDDRRQFQMGITQSREKPRDAVQRKIEPLGMETEKLLDLRCRFAGRYHRHATLAMRLFTAPRWRQRRS